MAHRHVPDAENGLRDREKLVTGYQFPVSGAPIMGFPGNWQPATGNPPFGCGKTPIHNWAELLIFVST